MLYNIPLFQCFVSPCNVYPVLFIVVDFIIHRQIRGGDRDALSPRPISFILTVRKRSLGQGDVLTPVCHSVHGGLHRGRGLGRHLPAPHQIARDTVNEQAVCILLECILVMQFWQKLIIGWCTAFWGSHFPLWKILDPPLKCYFKYHSWQQRINFNQTNPCLHK